MRVYPLESAGEFMCVSACVNMILMRRGMGARPQAELAYQLGLKVPAWLARTYPGAQVSENEVEWGVHPQEHETSLELLFGRYNIPLVERFYFPSEIPSSCGYAEFIDTQLTLGNDVIVGYDFATAFASGSHRGHVSLVCHADKATDEVWLLDPERPEDGPVSLTIRQLVAAIKAKNDGFWVIGTNESLRKSEGMF